MKRIFPEDTWPESWKYSYPYDLQEVYGEISNRGYAYAYDNRWQQTARMLREVLEPGAQVLDIAAAQGNFSLRLAELGYDVTWNDLRADLAEYVRLKHERGTVSYAPGNAFELKFPALFDAVLITEVIEHVAHPDEFLARCARLVRPGGYVIMTTPNGRYFKNKLPRFSECTDPSIYEAAQFGPDSDGHIFLLDRGEVRTLAQRAGLEITKLTLFTNPLTYGHLKTGVLLPMLPRRCVQTLEELSQRLPGGLQERMMIQLGACLRKA